MTTADKLYAFIRLHLSAAKKPIDRAERPCAELRVRQHLH